LRILHKLTILLSIAALLPFAAYSQDIETASAFFDKIAERYADIDDYIAEVSINREDGEMKGTVYYKEPNLLRLDFSKPEEQVLVTNGEKLTLYIPKYRVIMSQDLSKRSSASVANVASKEGLVLLKRNYSVAYLEGPEPIPLEEGSEEKVTKLKLTWRTSEEGFRQLNLSVTEDYLIRRIKAITADYKEIVFDFISIKLNQNISPSRFEYDPPDLANTFENFLFESED